MADVDNNATPMPDVNEQPTPAPQTSSPDMSGVSIPEQPANAQLNTPAQPMPQQPQQSGGLFQSILRVLAGNPQNSHIDPDTGKTISTPIESKKALGTLILADAFEGALRGMSAPPGPGHVGQAGALALQGGIEDQQRNRAAMQADYERQQQAQVQRFQVAHLNAQTALDTTNAQEAGMNTLGKAKEMNQDAVMQLVDSGAVEQNGDGSPVTMTQSDILAKIKSGELNAGDSIGMAYGGTLIDGKPQALYVVNKDPNAPVKISQAQFDQWTAAGVNVPKEVVGQSIPAKSFSAYSNQALVHATNDAALATLRHDAGTNKDLLSKLPTSVDPTTPGMGTALRTFQRALAGAKGNVYQALDSVMQTNRQSGQILVNALGGKSLIDDIQNQHTADVKSAQAAEEETARQKAALPFKEADQKFESDQRQKDRQATAQLQLQNQEAQKQLSNNLETNKDARDKVESTVLKPYTEKMGDIEQTRQAIAQVATNPVAARAVVFKMVGVSQPTGSHRVIPAEITAFHYPGGVAQSSIEKFNDFLLGKPWTAEAAQAATEFINGQATAAQNNLRRGVGNVNGLYGTKIDAERILNAGQTQAATSPFSATSSDGKWGWNGTAWVPNTTGAH